MKRKLPFTIIVTVIGFTSCTKQNIENNPIAANEISGLANYKKTINNGDTRLSFNSKLQLHDVVSNLETSLQQTGELGESYSSLRNNRNFVSYMEAQNIQARSK